MRKAIKTQKPIELFNLNNYKFFEVKRELRSGKTIIELKNFYQIMKQSLIGI